MSLILLASHRAHDGDWGPGPWWPLIPLFWILVIAAVLFFGRFVFGWRYSGWRYRHRYGRGLSALDERFARGEIDETEYRERRAVLLERTPRGRS